MSQIDQSGTPTGLILKPMRLLLELYSFKINLCSDLYTAKIHLTITKFSVSAKKKQSASFIILDECFLKHESVLQEQFSNIPGLSFSCRSPKLSTRFRKRVRVQDNAISHTVRFLLASNASNKPIRVF